MNTLLCWLQSLKLPKVTQSFDKLHTLSVEVPEFPKMKRSNISPSFRKESIVHSSYMLLAKSLSHHCQCFDMIFPGNVQVFVPKRLELGIEAGAFHGCSKSALTLEAWETSPGDVMGDGGDFFGKIPCQNGL